MIVMPKQTEQLELVLPDLAHVAIEIGLFDDAEHEADHRIVPLIRYLQELTPKPKNATELCIRPHHSDEKKAKRGAEPPTYTVNVEK
ncbi:MAG: hypothetical protein JJ897_06155 [Marinibacterium sp.]|nr:hypothetical protein [Marinibacterium sp.]